MKTLGKTKFNELDAIIAYEQGDLTQEDTIDLFQKLVDNGHAWQLQGHYGRTAMQLIEAGYVTRPGFKANGRKA